MGCEGLLAAVIVGATQYAPDQVRVELLRGEQIEPVVLTLSTYKRCTQENTDG